MIDLARRYWFVLAWLVLFFTFIVLDSRYNTSHGAACRKAGGEWVKYMCVKRVEYKKP